MSKRILIGSIACNFGEQLIEEFSEESNFELVYETNMDEVVRLIHEENFSACVINFDDITPVEFESCSRIVENLPHMPILILGNKNEFTQSLTTEKNRVHFLAKPVSCPQVRAFTAKLLLAKELPAQKYKRFKTDQEAEVEKIEDGDTFLASVKNLSMGGAYCTLQEDHRISIGSLIRLNVHNEDSQRKTLNAKVIWTKNSDEFENKIFSFGLEFINQNETLAK